MSALPPAHSAQLSAAWKRVRGWVRRRTVAGVMALVVLGGVAAWCIHRQYRQLSAAEAAARQQADALQQELYCRTVQLADRQLAEDHPDLAEATLRRGPPGPRSWEWRYLARRCRPATVVLRGHDGSVVDVCFSPDGDLVATVGQDDTARLWDVATGSARRIFRGAGGNLQSVCFADNGRRLIAAAGLDQSVRIWCVANGTSVAAIARAGGRLAGSPTSRFAAASREGAVTIFDSVTSKPVRPGRQLKSQPLAVALSPDGRRAAAVDAWGKLSYWTVDTDEGIPLDAPPSQQELPDSWALAFSADGRLLASGSKNIIVWDTATNRRERFSEGPFAARCKTLAFSPDGRLIAAGFADGSLRVWDRASGRSVRAPGDQPGGVEAIAFSPDGHRLAVPRGRDVTVERLYGPPAPACQILIDRQKPIRAIAFSPDHRRLAGRVGDDELLVWELPANEPLRRTLAAPAGPRASLVFLNETMLLSGCSGERVAAWNVTNGTPAELSIVAGPQPHPDEDAESVAVDPGGRRIATLSGAYRITVWDAAAGAATPPRQVEGSRVTCLALDADGQVAAGGSQGLLRLWPAAVGAPRRFMGLGGTVHAVAFSPSGDRLAAVAADGRLCAWDPATGAELFSQIAHAGSADSLAWSPDGLSLATGGEDGTIRLWDAATGQELLALSAHAGGVSALAFSSDGAWLASGGLDGTIRLWDGHAEASDAP